MWTATHIPTEAQPADAGGPKSACPCAGAGGRGETHHWVPPGTTTEGHPPALKPEGAWKYHSAVTYWGFSFPTAQFNSDVQNLWLWVSASL